MVECCFSSVRCTKAEDVTLNFGARGLTGFNLEEVGRARLKVLELNTMSEASNALGRLG